MTTPIFSFLIICDTNDPRNFHIECTLMSDYRLRFSAMKSNWNKSKTKKCKTTAAYCRLFECNYTYHLLEKKSFDTVEDATSYKCKLIAGTYSLHSATTNECSSVMYTPLCPN